ncbi:hypothetical protein PspTeo4_43968 [Pseudomonas sp. Teo4]|nr:hypothetical protein [Pseudomonas sp. Teo4]
MAESGGTRRSLMLVLHDIAPETWPDYQPFIQAVDELGNVPMTWLVVPDFHHRNLLSRSPTFCRVLERRLARGDELALHGFYHADDGRHRVAPPSTSCAASIPTKANSTASTGNKPCNAWKAAWRFSNSKAGQWQASSHLPG